MKKNKFHYLLFFALIGFAVCVQAQRSKSALGISGGYVPEGFGLEASMNIYHNLTDHYKIGVMATFSNETLTSGVTVPYNDFLLNAGYFTPLFQSPSSGISFEVGGGVSLGYENVNNGESLLSDGSILLSKSGFVYGISAGTDFDLFLSNSISVFVPFTAIYQFNSDLGSFILYGGLGLRYSFAP